MTIAVLIAALVITYAVKAAYIARKHDEMIADDAMMCWCKADEKVLKEQLSGY